MASLRSIALGIALGSIAGLAALAPLAVAADQSHSAPSLYLTSTSGRHILNAPAQENDSLSGGGGPAAANWPAVKLMDTTVGIDALRSGPAEAAGEDRIYTWTKLQELPVGRQDAGAPVALGSLAGTGSVADLFANARTAGGAAVGPDATVARGFAPAVGPRQDAASATSLQQSLLIARQQALRDVQAVPKTTSLITAPNFNGASLAANKAKLALPLNLKQIVVTLP